MHYIGAALGILPAGLLAFALVWVSLGVSLGFTAALLPINLVAATYYRDAWILILPLTVGVEELRLLTGRQRN